MNDSTAVRLYFPAVLAAGLLLLGAPDLLGMEPADLDRCVAIVEDADRLRCFDELARDASQTDLIPTPAASAEAPTAVPEQTATSPEPKADVTSPMQERWELVPTSSRPIFTLKPHKPTYVLPVRYSDSPNEAPYSPQNPDVPTAALDEVETKFQLSLKAKAIPGIFGNNGDLWLGYTQQNHWQVFNKDTSSPFRETNYEPEVMLVFRTAYELLGLKGRFVNFGLAHHSNGRAEPLSRSWNRLYVQVGLERGNFAVLARGWHRIEESLDEDNNPDIEDYMGNSDVLLSYQRGAYRWSALVRRNFDTGHGAVELGWAFPLTAKLKGYVQLFDGYGESMIDYNHSQTTIGAGFIVVDWY